ncbi:MAG: hypothetical protein ABSC76_15920 [Terracidiphilus sp.]|jgi:hypothetical protein
MTSNDERFSNSSAGVKLAYERPTAVFASPSQESRLMANGNYPSSNSPCDDCQPEPGNYPSSGSPCADCEPDPAN